MLLFSYGSLRDPDVQMSTFRRHLVGHRDVLPGYTRTTAVSNGRELGNVIPASAGNAGVEGTAFIVTEAELSLADEYEAADGYTRIEVTLASGRRAWVYMHAGA